MKARSFAARALIAAAALASFVAPPADAGAAPLIAQESFDYAAGSLDGRNGGSGWSSAWKGSGDLTTSPAAANVQASSLAAPPWTTKARSSTRHPKPKK